MGQNRPGEVFVDELFDQLMDLPVDERLATLDEQTADDSIRAEVRALLAMAGQAPPPREGTAAVEPEEGWKIQHYRLGRALGSGAAGSV